VATEPSLSPEIVRAIAEVLGETSTGLTNAEITRVLAATNIADPKPHDPSGMTYVAMNKRDRIERALLDRQRADGHANGVLRFVKAALAPARFHSEPERLDHLLASVNVPLRLASLELGDDGRLQRVRKAATLSEARRRALALQTKLGERGTHRRLLAACVQEIADENYFHAVLEASKSLAAEIRNKTGRIEEGVGLIDIVFEKGSRGYPLMALNALRTDTERSRQKGLADGLRSVFSSLRNPTAHELRIESRMTEQDALDAFAWMSYLHRRLDDCHVIPDRNAAVRSC
jgi:uncharacterized protein (TIGR02391 family)